MKRRGTNRVSLRNPGFDHIGLKRKIVRGRPITVGEHEVTPEAEVITWQMKDARIGSGSSASMWGVSFAQLRPSGLLDRSVDGERLVKIVDRNRQIELILLIAAVLLPIVLNAMANLVRRTRTKA